MYRSEVLNSREEFYEWLESEDIDVEEDSEKPYTYPCISVAQLIRGCASFEFIYPEDFNV